MVIEVQSLSNYMCVHMYIHETERMCVESWIGFSGEMSWTVVSPVYCWPHPNSSHISCNTSTSIKPSQLHIFLSLHVCETERICVES